MRAEKSLTLTRQTLSGCLSQLFSGRKALDSPCSAAVSSVGTTQIFDESEAAPACLHQAVSYVGILAGLAPDDRWSFADEPRRWLDRAVGLVR